MNEEMQTLDWKEIDTNEFKSPQDLAKVVSAGDIIHCSGMQKEIVLETKGYWDLITFRRLHDTPPVYDVLGYREKWVGERIELIQSSHTLYSKLNSEWEEKIK